MHLKQLKLENFKSHSNSVIVFDQITSLIGRNDCGKTNILRALKLLLHHEDWPTSWIKYGKTSASIELTLVDGTIITRKRTLKSQSIEVVKGGKTTTFTGKEDATEFLQKAVGIKKITLDETTGPEDLNFIEVNANPYLIGGRADTVQRKVAGIVGANTIDDIRSRLTKEAKDLESQITSLDETISKLNPTVQGGKSFIERANNILKDIQELDNQGCNYETKLQVLNDFVNDIQTISSLIITSNVVQNITDLNLEIGLLKKQLQKIALDSYSAAQLSSQQITIEKYLKNTDMVDQMYKEITRDKLALINLTTQILSLSKFSEVTALEAYLKNVDQELLGYQIELVNLNKEKDLQLKILGLCPMCKRSII